MPELSPCNDISWRGFKMLLAGIKTRLWGSSVFYCEGGSLGRIAVALTAGAVLSSMAGIGHADANNVIDVTPHNLNNYVDDVDGTKWFRSSGQAGDVYVFSNTATEGAWPNLSRLGINSDNVVVKFNDSSSDNQLSRFNGNDTFQVTGFDLSAGKLEVDANATMRLETNEIMQSGGLIKVSSHSDDVVGLLAQDIKMVDGQIDIDASVGNGVQANLTMDNGNVSVVAKRDEQGGRDAIGWRGSIVQTGGMFNATAYGNTAVSSHNFHFSGGHLNVSALSVDPQTGAIGVSNIGSFVQDGGNAVIAASGAGASGLVLERGASYQMMASGGQLRIHADNGGIGVRNSESTADDIARKEPGLQSDAIGNDTRTPGFVQDEGDVIIDSESGAIGMVVGREGYKLTGGTLVISAKSGGKGLVVENDNVGSNRFEQTGGSLAISAQGQGSIGLESTNVLITGGTLSLKGSNEARALYIGDGSFFLNGTLRLEQDDESHTGWAAYGEDSSQAVFGKGSVVQTVVNLESAGQKTGLMSFGHVQVDPGAGLELEFANTAGIASADVMEIPFLESRMSAIDGEFEFLAGSGAGSTLFYDYVLERSADDQSYIVKVRAKDVDNGSTGGSTGGGDTVDEGGDDSYEVLRPSHLLNGANHNASLVLENALPGTAHLSNYTNLNRAYDKLYNSRTKAELEQHARGLHAHQTTRFSTLASANHDRMDAGLQREIGRVSATSSQGGGMVGWANPAGSIDHYKRTSSSGSNLDAKYGGLALGVARRLDNVTIGLSGGYLYGDLDGGKSYSATSQTYMFMAGARIDPVEVSAHLKPTFDLGLSYGLTRTDQNRRDTLGGHNKSKVDSDSIRVSGGVSQAFMPSETVELTPRIALDYTFVSLDSYKEHGGYLPLSVSSHDYNSLRPKFGGEMVWYAKPQFAVNAYGYYRYETLDTRSNLATQFTALPDMHFTTMGTKSSRSTGNLGLGMSYQMKDAISVSGGYDVTVGKHYDGHQLYLQGNAKF